MNPLVYNNIIKCLEEYHEEVDTILPDVDVDSTIFGDCEVDILDMKLFKKMLENRSISVKLHESITIKDILDRSI